MELKSKKKTESDLNLLFESVPVALQNWSENIAPMVSISCVTYNHEPYIRDAIEGFLMQKTTFPVQILIHDDASTDGTTEIIKTYEEKYPCLIKCFYQTENTYKKPNYLNFRKSFYSARKGKYIAICEGDDFWTDPLKLQKQVTFMEQNADVSLCGHYGNILEKERLQMPKLSHRRVVYPSMVTLIQSITLLAASICYRKPVMPLPEWCQSLKSTDHPTYFQAYTLGKIAILPDNMCTYRIHPGGVWSSNNTFPAGLVRNAKETLKYHRLLQIHYPFSFLEAKANNWRIIELSALIIKMYKCRHLKKYSTTWAYCMIPVIFIRFGYEILKISNILNTLKNKILKTTDSYVYF
jgi:glycosyltransferase involved in cell wall biosynthesis